MAKSFDDKIDDLIAEIADQIRDLQRKRSALVATRSTPQKAKAGPKGKRGRRATIDEKEFAKLVK